MSALWAVVGQINGTEQAVHSREHADAMVEALAGMGISAVAAEWSGTPLGASGRHGREREMGGDGSMTHTPDQPAWVMVPETPTEAMLQGGCAKHTPGQHMSDRPGGDRECPSFERRRRIWAHMLAAAPSRPDQEAPEPAAWLSLAAAPKDETEVELLIVHPSAMYSEDPFGDGWVETVRGKWIDHNGGGWTWNGLCGRVFGWRPLYTSPSPAKVEVTREEVLKIITDAVISASVEVPEDFRARCQMRQTISTNTTDRILALFHPAQGWGRP